MLFHVEINIENSLKTMYPFAFHGGKQIVLVWNNVGMRKGWQIFHFECIIFILCLSGICHLSQINIYYNKL